MWVWVGERKKHQGTPGFSAWFHLPGFHVGHLFFDPHPCKEIRVFFLDGCCVQRSLTFSVLVQWTRREMGMTIGHGWRDGSKGTPSHVYHLLCCPVVPFFSFFLGRVSLESQPTKNGCPCFPMATGHLSFVFGVAMCYPLVWEWVLFPDTETPDKQIVQFSSRRNISYKAPFFIRVVWWFSTL